MNDILKIAGREIRSRLWVGTGKYKDFAETKKAIEASGAHVVTVAVRRVNITDRSKEGLFDYIDPEKYIILPNTAGCYTAKDAIRTAGLARAAGVSDMVKLEVIGDEKTLMPDNEALLEAAKELVKEGFIVLPYTNDDPIMARKLQDAGCHAILMNTAIACAKDPIKMACAMKMAVDAGRLAYLAGRIPRKLYASASSPLEGMIE